MHYFYMKNLDVTFICSYFILWILCSEIYASIQNSFTYNLTNFSTNFYSLISPCIHHTMVMKWRTIAFAVFIFSCNFPFLLSLWTNVDSFSCCRWYDAFPSGYNTLQSFETGSFLFDLLHDIHALHDDVLNIA